MKGLRLINFKQEKYQNKLQYRQFFTELKNLSNKKHPIY